MFVTTLNDIPTLTVIVPCYNEVATINMLLQRVVAAPYDKQIVVVDDGSTDGTTDVLRSWHGHADILILAHTQNRGKGAAIRTALAHAKGRFTIIQDGDLETDPEDYPKLVEPLLNGEAEFVIGSRFIEGTPSVRYNKLLRFGVLLLNRCLHILYGIRLTDEACCYKALSTATLTAMDLQCERFEFCPEVVAKVCRLGLRIREVPISYHPRNHAEGKKLRFRDGFQALSTLWRFRRWTQEVDGRGVQRQHISCARIGD